MHTIVKHNLGQQPLLGSRRSFSAPRHLQKRRERACSAVCAIKARWCIDIKYGVKMEALALVQDWIQNVGSAAGLTQENTCLSSGAVGAPESRLELEVEFETLAHVEDFWAAIPPAEHRAWSQRAQNFIIDGSPRWELYRTCPVYAGMEGSSTAATAILKAWGASTSTSIPSKSDEKTTVPQGNLLGEYLLKASKSKVDEVLGAPTAIPSESFEAEKPDGLREGQRIATDWKGDPMIINPGDNMPMF